MEHRKTNIAMTQSNSRRYMRTLTQDDSRLPMTFLSETLSRTCNMVRRISPAIRRIGAEQTPSSR